MLGFPWFFSVSFPVVSPFVLAVAVPVLNVNLVCEVVFSDLDCDFVEPQTLLSAETRSASDSHYDDDSRSACCVAVGTTLQVARRILSAATLPASCLSTKHSVPRNQRNFGKADFQQLWCHSVGLRVAKESFGRGSVCDLIKCIRSSELGGFGLSFCTWVGASWKR